MKNKKQRVNRQDPFGHSAADEVSIDEQNTTTCNSFSVFERQVLMHFACNFPTATGAKYTSVLASPMLASVLRRSHRWPVVNRWGALLT